MKQLTKKNTRNKQFLFYGDFNCDTGFGHVSKELINVWAKDKSLQITVFAINDQNEFTYKYLPNVTVIPALTTSKQKDDVYCRRELLNVLYNGNFDVVFFLNDVEVFNGVLEHLNIVKNKRKNENKKKFKSILYFPIDSAPRKKDLEVLQFFDEIITYTDYGRSTVIPLVSESIAKKIRVIPHGCNTDDFHPLGIFEKSKIREEMYGTDDLYVFGTVNRNSLRKDLATLIIGFSLFKNATQAPAVLYLHCNPTDSSGINIYNLCERLGLNIGKDIFLPADYSENKGYLPEQLNRVYNSFDCFITTTTAEGWGLTITEAMATKCLVVCPLHTSLSEITNQGMNSLYFKHQEPAVFVGDIEKIRYISLSSEVARVMSEVITYQGAVDIVREHLAKKIDDAYNKVKNMRWTPIALQFQEIINRLSK